MEHTLVRVEAVDVGYESTCSCGQTEWSMTKSGATVAIEAHTDRILQGLAS